MKHRSGSSLIEVTLFLGITGLLLVGILSSTWTSIARQRATDTVQNFADFLRGQYSATTSVQHGSTGNHNQAIYGRVITFNEDDSNRAIYSYSLRGDIKSSDELVRLSVPEALNAVNADIATMTGCGAGSCPYEIFDRTEYRLNNGATLQAIYTRNKNADASSAYVVSDVSVVITRSPTSGSLYTFIILDTPNVQKYLNGDSPNPTINGIINDSDPDTNDYEENFMSQTLDFCIQPQDNAGDRTYDIRLYADATNSSGVDIIDLDSDDNICNEP